MRRRRAIQRTIDAGDSCAGLRSWRQTQAAPDRRPNIDPENGHTTGGAAAMTGVEAISNGFPAFRPVEWKNARKVLGWLGVLLGVMFIGISYLAWKLHPLPSTKETVISQIARAIVGHGT